MISRRSFTHTMAHASALASLGLPLTGRSQTPADTVKILVGFPAGGTTDALARHVADKLRGQYAGSVGVENKPGGGGQLAVTAVRDSLADGNTLLLTPSSILSIYPFTVPKLPYTVDELAPVSVASFISHGFSVGPAVPQSVKTIKEFLAWAKANPEQANFGSPAPGSMPHLLVAFLSRITGVPLKHIPYRGSVPGLQDLLAGKISAMSSPVGDCMPYLKGGKLRLLAVSATKRSPFAPDVPTYREQGFPISMREWYGFFLPGKASAQAVRRAAAYLQPALANAELSTSLAQIGMEAQSSTPEQLSALLRADANEWRRLIKMIGFTAES